MKKKSINYKTLGISVSITLICLIFCQVFLTPVPGEKLFTRLLIPLGRLILFIFIGLCAGQLIEAFGWTRSMAVVARPAFRFSRLGDRCSAAFTAAFISGVTANAMLLDFYKDDKISKPQLFLSNWINQFPAFFLHLPTTLFIILPLTGRAGLVYLVITFTATLLRTFCFFLSGRLLLPRNPDRNPSRALPGKPDNQPEKSAVSILKSIGTRLPVRLANIITWVLPIYTIVFLLNHFGFFQYLNQTVSEIFTVTFIPVESLSVVILSFAAEFTSGFAAAGALMNAGLLTVKQTVLALLFGNVLAFPIRAIRHQLPRYMGIFSPKMGLQLLLSGQVFRILSLILIGTLYYMVA